MVRRILAYLIFAVLMTVSIAFSTVIVVFFYLPMVALKAVYQAVSGKIAVQPSERGKTA